MLNSYLMHPDVATALRLQALDLRANELRREIAALPKRILEIEKALESHTRRLELDRAALSANQKERKKIEGDIQLHRQKISKLRDQMMEAKTNQQYRAFQEEIQYFEQAISKAEDQILELMLEAEKLESNVRKAEADLAEERKSVEAEKEQAKARTQADREELKRIEADRREVAARISPEVLSAYERLRTRHYPAGDVLAEARDGRCLGCMMTIRPQLFQDVKSGASVVYCETCRRILYAEEPARDVEAQMNV
jgi:predicted  nucleic acid-binding Zn-ribbon protein